MELQNVLQQRRSIRKYATDKKVTKEEVFENINNNL